MEEEEEQNEPFAFARECVLVDGGGGDSVSSTEMLRSLWFDGEDRVMLETGIWVWAAREGLIEGSA